MFATRLSLVAIYLLRFASPVHSLHAKRSVDDAELIARAFEINADAVFPHQADKRGLFGPILSGLGNGVDTLLNDAGGAVNTLLGGGAAAVTSTVAAVINPTTTAANNNNNGGGNTAAPAPTTANGGGSGNAGNSNANNAGSGTTSANNNGNNNNGNSNGNGANTNNANGNGAASASGSGNSANGGTVPMNAFYTHSGPITVAVLTDHSGHTITTTGTGAITLTYVTTLPNGVVSTVTEVITPTAEVFGEPVVAHSSASRIGAIAGTIVSLILVCLIVAFVLIMRKRRRRIQLANSRPESTLSFGSSDILNHRNSTEPLGPTGSMTSFRTAEAYVDGQKMDFPLPPTPTADLNRNEMAATSQRPISMGSDLTNDLMERRSRTSLIAERNLYRKVGQYPDAGSYTPFALAPSSELGHSEEAFDHNNAYEGTSNTKEFHEHYRRSRNLDFAPSVHENPFNDPAHVAQPAPPVPALSNQRQSGLWRKATFGSSQQPPSKRLESHPPSSFAQPHVDTFGRKSSTASADRGTVMSHASSDYETATETQSKHSSGGFSYHSAFARYASDPTVENPFADHNGAGSPPPSSRLLTSSTGWRPATAGSTASLSVMSSTGNSARELGSTPDPKDLFYHPPSTGQSMRPSTAASQPPRPWSADSTRVSEDNQTEETIRQKNIAYPSLSGVVQQMQARR